MSTVPSSGGMAGNQPASQVHAQFDQVARSAPPSAIAEGLAHAFNSDQTPPFQEMVANMYAHSDPEQKAGLLQRLVQSLGPQGVKQALGGNASPEIANGQITPQQAQQIQPHTVEAMAYEAQKRDPSVVQRSAEFYSQHPTLVKALGVGALALLVGKMTAGRR